MPQSYCEITSKSPSKSPINILILCKLNEKVTEWFRFCKTFVRRNIEYLIVLVNNITLSTDIQQPDYKLQLNVYTHGYDWLRIFWRVASSGAYANTRSLFYKTATLAFQMFYI